jgi:hypothetical protein
MKEEDKNINNSPGFGFTNDQEQRNGLFSGEKDYNLSDDEIGN